MENRQTRRIRLGREGEAAAVRYLAGRGFRILELGYRRLRGEIDIIALDGDTLVFVEVKTRTDPEFGPPEEAVTRSKQGQIRRIAEVYLSERGREPPACRFDVVAVELEAGGRFVVRHLVDAF